MIVFSEDALSGREGRCGKGGGLDRSVYDNAGIVPSPSHPRSAVDDVAAEPLSQFDCIPEESSEVAAGNVLSLCRDNLSASSKSMRSLHWTSSCLILSTNARSVSDRGE